MRIALTLLLACFASQAKPCSIIQPRDVPFSFEHYVFYGEVLGYVSTRMQQCGDDTDPAQCPPSWGLRIRIIEPVQVPARKVTEVEYFDFGMDSMCDYTPVPEEAVQRRFPVGTRVAVAASPYVQGEPAPGQVRLTTLNPPIGEALAILPTGADLRKLAATPFNYAGYFNGPTSGKDPAGFSARLSFELWRDKLRLHNTRAEREVLPILVSMASVQLLVNVVANEEYSAIEQLLDQYLPTPSLRDEFEARLRDARYDAGNMDEAEKRVIALGRARRGDARAMFDYAVLINKLPWDSAERDPASALEWMRRSVRAGFFPAALEFEDLAKDTLQEPPQDGLTRDMIENEAEEYIASTEKRALSAARRSDPAAYLFLSEHYLKRGKRPPSPWNTDSVDYRKKAEQFTCLLAKHPQAPQLLKYSSAAWWYCPGAPPVESIDN